MLVGKGFMGIGNSHYIYVHIARPHNKFGFDWSKGVVPSIGVCEEQTNIQTLLYIQGF